MEYHPETLGFVPLGVDPCIMEYSPLVRVSGARSSSGSGFRLQSSRVQIWGFCFMYVLVEQRLMIKTLHDLQYLIHLGLLCHSIPRSCRVLSLSSIDPYTITVAVYFSNFFST